MKYLKRKNPFRKNFSTGRGFKMFLCYAAWSHLYNLPAAFLNITPKPDMLQISFLAKTFQSLCLRKRINFTFAFYESPTDTIQ